MSKKVTVKENLLEAFPYGLARDENKEALADVVAAELVKLLCGVDKSLIYTQIDELDEAVLDILAYDLKMDWYDTEAGIENKRQAIKECILVHKFKGTKYAVETAMRSMYDKVAVSEWFEYGGEPYHFQIAIYASTNDAGKRSKIIGKLQYAKNLRSVLDEVIFEIIPDKPLNLTAGIKTCGISKRIHSQAEQADSSIFAIKTAFRAGFAVGGIYKKIRAEVREHGMEQRGTYRQRA
mgnify:FL=1